MTVAKKLIACYLVVLMLMATIAFVSIFNFRALADRTDYIIKNITPIGDGVDGILTDLVSEETGIRGLLITGDMSFLDAYDKGKREIGEKIKELDTLTTSHSTLIPLIAQAKVNLEA